MLFTISFIVIVLGFVSILEVANFDLWEEKEGFFPWVVDFCFVQPYKRVLKNTLPFIRHKAVDIYGSNEMTLVGKLLCDCVWSTLTLCGVVTWLLWVVCSPMLFVVCFVIVGLLLGIFWVCERVVFGVWNLGQLVFVRKGHRKIYWGTK